MSLPQPPSQAPQIPACYRHPDREGWRSCTRCGRPACSDCLVQASVGSQCVDCAKAGRPDAKTRAVRWNAGQPTLITFVLIGINVAVFAWISLADPNSLGGRGGITRQQFDLGLNKALLGFTHEWYRLVTAGFLHFGFMHLAFNMFMLYQLGQLLERSLGRAQFVLLYGASLLAGSFGVLILDSAGISGGASGAVFGLLAAAAIGMHRRGVNVFSTGIGTTLLLNLFITFAIPGISIGGHLGGAVGGAVCGYVMLAPKWRSFPTWALWFAPVAVAVVSVAGSIIIVG